MSVTERLGVHDAFDERARQEARLLAPSRTRGIATDLPRDEIVRPPDAPGYIDRLVLCDGTVLTPGTIFIVANSRDWRRRPRMVFRRAHIDTQIITAWGPISGPSERWHTFLPCEVLGLL